MRTLNLGILAHVDAGKTSLTERLLYAAGVIDSLGRVDDGNTRTDTLELERRRGITIRSAVVAFTVGDVAINLIDTPGHPDFIAEVERVLGVLDGAVLVVSAVEGVQAQTRILMRALRRLGIPTLIFVNKVDRAGADTVRTLRAITGKLSAAVVPVTAARCAGSSAAAVVPSESFVDDAADVLAGQDDGLLKSYVDGSLTGDALWPVLAAQTRRALVHPVYCGSAVTGAGIDALIAGITGLLPAASPDPGGEPAGVVFTVDRDAAGAKLAYVRMFAGTLRVRDRPSFGARAQERITAIEVFEAGSTVRSAAVCGGQIGRLRGLSGIRIGDVLGDAPAVARHFAPPTLETVVLPVNPADRGALHLALTQLAEQDPLIDVRLDELRGEASVSLYGEVQKEVIQATLAEEFGVAVEFLPSTTICVERPAGTGEAVELIGTRENPFFGTVGLRVQPGDGVTFRLGVELGSLPLAFFRAVEDTVLDTLRQGLHGWAVRDCAVTMTHSGYDSPISTAADFRNLTPLVLMSALRRAGTRVYEPMHRFGMDLPQDALGGVSAVLARLRAVARSSTARGAECTVDGEIPAASVHELRARLPGLTRGEGVLDSEFDRYAAVRGAPPSRPRTDRNPLDRREYLLRTAGTM